MNTDSIKDSIFNSGNFLTLEDSISSSKDNPIDISRLTKRVNYQGNYIIEEPHTLLNRYKTVLMRKLEWYTLDNPRLKGRPDAISEIYYGTPDLWFLIMWANNALNPIELFTDAIKVIPISKVNKVIEIALSSQEEINKNHNNIPIAKDSTLVVLPES